MGPPADPFRGYRQEGDPVTAGHERLELSTDHVLTADPEPPSAGETLTLVEGSTFVVSDRSGDVHEDLSHGLFFRDTRILSRWALTVAGGTLETLSVQQEHPFDVTIVSRVVRPGAATDLVVERRRAVSQGLREDLRLRNLSPRPLDVRLVLTIAADFADIFDVKDRRASSGGEVRTRAAGESLSLGLADRRRGVQVRAHGAVAHPDGLHFRCRVPGRGEWSTRVLVRPSLDDQDVPGPFEPDAEGTGAPALPIERLQDWRARAPVLRSTDPALQRTMERTLVDLGALRIADPSLDGAEVVAAGAPWFMALFGRDSLLTSCMALPVDAGLAVGTLRALARSQGTRTDDRTEEEPGRILHERRSGLDFPLARGGASTYYGTVDATPLFVVVLGELARRGVFPEVVDELLPHADRALDWITQVGDRDGDGFLEYRRATPSGLLNQGWKDSFDGINHADGTLAVGPIAVCEAQGYAYAAFRARAELAAAAGDEATAAEFTTRAERLRTAFDEAFWLPDRGWYAVALDGEKVPVDALTSNVGHLLWSGIVEERRAAQLVEHLMSPQMFSGWGVRTLATTMGAYNPVSYHNGSVWPHDNALLVAGLVRYGFLDEARRIGQALLEAAAAFDGRLPELFCGFDRSDYSAPVPYPTSCSPQAWSTAAPLLVVSSLLRIVPGPRPDDVTFAPGWPAALGGLTVEGLLLGGERMDLRIDGEQAELTGAGRTRRAVNDTGRDDTSGRRP